MKKKKVSKVVTFFALGILAVIWIVPIVWAVFTSFKTETEIKTGGFGFLPKEWTVTNYIEIFTNTDNAPILRWFGNSMIMAVSVTVLTVILVAVTAYGYSRLKFKYRDTLFYTLMGISLFPNVINIIPLYQMMTWLDWVNNIMAMIVPGLGAVTNIFLVRQFALAIPREFDEAAKIAVDTVKNFLKKDERIEKVIFNVFKDLDLDIYEKLLEE